MPIIWKYLLKSYFKVLTLCISAFVAVLVVIRFQEIACFASSGASLSYVGLFTLYQIPYILPIAIPVSCLIAAMLLFQNASRTHELTALRTSGLSLPSIASPLVLAGLLLSIVNFTITSELTPYTRSLSQKLIYEITMQNPLVLLQKDSIVKIKNSHIDFKNRQSGKKAEDVIFVTMHSTNNRVGITLAKELSIHDHLLMGKQVSLISSLDSKIPGFDHLIIENQQTMETEAANLSQYLQKKGWASGNEFHSLRCILAKEKVKSSPKKFRISSSARLEISRRITLGLAPFTFTLIGVAFGTDIGRMRKKKGVCIAFILVAFFMMSYVAAKSFHRTPNIANLIHLSPHLIIGLVCLNALRSVSRGQE